MAVKKPRKDTGYKIVVRVHKAQLDELAKMAARRGEKISVIVREALAEKSRRERIEQIMEVTNAEP